MGRPRVGLTESSFLVLGLLTFGRRSGYDLLKLGEESIGGFHRMPSRAQVYTELRKLEEAGLASSTAVAQESKPNKREYRITRRGSSALRRWLQEVDAPPLSGLALAVIFFGGQLPASALAQRLRDYQEDAERRLTVLRGIELQLDQDPQTFHPMLVARAGIAQYEACVQWARDSLAVLGEVV